MQLARRGLMIQPIYLMGVDSRQSMDIELALMPRLIRMVSNKYPICEIFPVKLVHRDQIPENQEIDLAAAVSTSAKGAARQYQYMARHSLACGIVAEIGLNKMEPGFPHGRSKKGFRPFLDNQLKGIGDGCRIKNLDNPVYGVFRNLRFPIFHMTKSEMLAEAEAFGGADILALTYSCWRPRDDGSPCGQCYCCEERYFNVSLSKHENKTFFQRAEDSLG
jgi:hypothetical protein